MRKTKWIIVLLAVIIHLYFYVSAFKTHSLDKYFLPVTQGQDFFQIPNAAHSFLRGGDLQGNINGLKNTYTNCCGVNTNVYHPFFTLLVGIPLQFFSPPTAFYFWGLLHLLVDIFIVIFLIKKFKNNPHLTTALVIFLASSFSYYEILNNQYHFLLNLATFLLLYELSINKDRLAAFFYFFTGLIIKPIGFLWLIPLALQKKYKVIGLGLGLFFLVTAPFYFMPVAKYYFQNLGTVIKSSYPDWNIFFLPFSLGASVNFVKDIKLVLAGALGIINLFNRKRGFQMIVLWIIYVLLTFQSNYPYHFSILSFVLPLVILQEKPTIKIIEWLGLAVLTIPAPIYLYRLGYLPLFIKDPATTEKFIFLAWAYLGLLIFASWFIFNLIVNSAAKPINKKY